MSQNTLAEYRNLYRDRHGIECPLSDANIRAAMVTADVLEDEWPLVPAVLTEMEALVTSLFPGVDQTRWPHGLPALAASFALTAVAGSPASTAVDLSWVVPVGALPTVNYQVQQAPDVAGSPGTFVDVGTPITALLLAITGLTTATKYHWRVNAVDGEGRTSTSTVQTLTTA